MFYKVFDIELEYEPGDEIIADRVEADTAEDAIIVALQAISPTVSSFVSEGLRNNPEEFTEHVLSAFKAEAVGYSAESPDRIYPEFT